MRSCLRRPTRRTLAARTIELDVRGAVPPGLSGRLVGIGRGRRRPLGASCGDGRVVVQPTAGLRTEHGRPQPRRLRRLDPRVRRRLTRLRAEHRRSTRCAVSTSRATGASLAASPKHDPATGELHLIAHDTDGLAGARRRLRRCAHPPQPTHPRRPRAASEDLALSRDHVVFVADGFVGVASRNGELRTDLDRDRCRRRRTRCTRTTPATPSSCSRSPRRSSGGRCTPKPGPSSARCSIRRPDASPAAATRRRRGAALRVDHGDGTDRPPRSRRRPDHVHHNLGRSVPGDFVLRHRCDCDRATPTAAGSSGSSTTRPAERPSSA